tara:strand:- start:367 stop:1224 length:858 start_codon:yes stop_codon:yes gene_type:complete
MQKFGKKLAAMTFVVAGFASAAFTGAQAEGGAVKLYTLDCGTVNMLDLSVFSREGKYVGEKNLAADPCYLITHPKGNFLWDTGLPQALADMPEGLINGPFHLKVKTKLTDQLAQLNLTPADITYLSISHSHFDHIGNAGLFAEATFIIEEKERAHMFRDEERANAETFAAFSALETAKTIEFKGQHDVFGDGSAIITSLSGHTPGHSVLLLELGNAGPVYLTGDMYHFTKARENRTVPKFNTDPVETLVSMDKFEAMVAESGALVVIQHEKSDFEKMPKFPAYLD